MSTKPSFLWHADENGRCHAGCEAWNQLASQRIEIPYCDIAAMLPFYIVNGGINIGRPCPFAVLAEVLCINHKKEEKP